MKLKRIIHTLIVSHMCRIIRALSKVKEFMLDILNNPTNNIIHFPYTSSSSQKKRRNKIIMGSFRLHYNWCSSKSSHVLPVPQRVYEGLCCEESSSTTQSNNGGEDCPDLQLAGYLRWLEEKKVQEGEEKEKEKEKEKERVKERELHMGQCFGSLSSAQNPSSSTLSKAQYSGSASTDSRNVGFSATTASSAGKSQFSEIASGSIIDDGTSSLPSSSGQILERPNLKVFSFGDLKSATKSFKSDTLLGEGGFGRVYKGWLDEKTLTPAKAGSGMVVAIKKLNSESTQGFQEWQSEVNFLGRLSHPNLVKLLGYCWDDDELLLVYEFMPKGSLENHLFRRNPNIEPLSWNTRIKIAIGAARGLAFLHASEKQVIYRDFKASNILLDGNYNAKISDFGLAKLGPAVGASHVTTRVMGTYGYAAPEYIATGHLYVKSDVYGFGVVLLEMMSGLRALDTKRPTGQQNLVEWVKPNLSNKRKLKTIMDARIDGQYSQKAAQQAAQLTLKCLEPVPKNRPSMKEVVEALEAIESMQDKSKESKNRGSHSSAASKSHHHSRQRVLKAKV